MTTGAELLGDFLRRLDLDSFSAAVDPELICAARAALPELRSAEEEPLRQLLGAATLEGVRRLTQAAELELRVEGPGPDDVVAALEDTIEAIRLALGLLISPPGTSPEQVEERNLLGLMHLANVVAAWDER